MNPSNGNFEQVPLVSKDSADWYRNGLELANLSRYPEALVCFDQALTLQPNEPNTWTFRAVMLIYLERYQDALDSCDRALRLCSTDAEAWLFRGVALQRLGRYREAYSNYDRALVGNALENHSPLRVRIRRRLKHIWQVIRGSGHPA